MKQHKIRAKRLAICALLLLLMCGLGYAAYTNQGYKKGVVSTERGAVRFCSDVLSAALAGAATEKMQLVPFSSAEFAEETCFSVYNHPLGNPMQYNSADIACNLVFEIVGESGAEKPGLRIGDGDYEAMTGTVATIPCTLTGGAASSFTCSIRFPGAAIGAYRLRVSVTPSDPASRRAVQNHELSCLYVPVLSTEGQSTELSADNAFTDPRDGHTPDEYHAFNYQISMQNYSGTVTLTWNEKLQPDPFFLERMRTEKDAQITEQSLSLTVSEETANYEFVFYRTDTAFSNPTSWEELDGCVGFSATSDP